MKLLKHNPRQVMEDKFNRIRCVLFYLYGQELQKFIFAI